MIINIVCLGQQYWIATNQKMMSLPKIQALVLSQFHINKGFTIIEVIQKQQHITESKFTIYSQLILYREQLCGRLLVSEFMDYYYIVGIPCLSVNTQEKKPYERTKYLYAVSMVVQRERYKNEILHEVYKQIIGKLAHFFKFIEQSSNIIYNNKLPQNQKYLKLQLQKAFRHINSNQQFVLSHFSYCFTIINLNRSPFEREKKSIKKSHVPITQLTQQEIDEIQSEFGKKLLRFARIGDYNIGKICQILENESAVYAYYTAAIKMGVVFLVDMFSLQNRYCLTNKIHKYVGNRKNKEEQELQQICKLIQMKKASNGKLENKAIKLNPNMLMYIYFQISRKDTFKKIVDSNINLFYHINIIKFLRISQIYGLLERIHQKFVIDDQGENIDYYISEDRLKCYLTESKSAQTSGIGSISDQCERLNSLFRSHLTNMDTIDQICVSLKICRFDLLQLIDFNGQKDLKIFYVSQ